jgi:predicted DNA-binding protein
VAPPRKSPAPGQGREYKIRLPEDVAQRIEARAKEQGRPQNRVIINELAAIPDLEQTAKLATLVKDMEIVLARYAAQISAHDLSSQLLNAVDAVLNAEGSALTAAVERLRVVRAGMLAHDQAYSKRKPAKKNASRAGRLKPGGTM